MNKTAVESQDRIKYRHENSKNRALFNDNHPSKRSQTQSRKLIKRRLKTKLCKVVLTPIRLEQHLKMLSPAEADSHYHADDVWNTALEIKEKLYRYLHVLHGTNPEQLFQEYQQLSKRYLLAYKKAYKTLRDATQERYAVEHIYPAKKEFLDTFCLMKWAFIDPVYRVKNACSTNAEAARGTNPNLTRTIHTIVEKFQMDSTESETVLTDTSWEKYLSENNSEAFENHDKANDYWNKALQVKERFCHYLRTLGEDSPDPKQLFQKYRKLTIQCIDTYQSIHKILPAHHRDYYYQHVIKVCQEEFDSTNCRIESIFTLIQLAREGALMRDALTIITQSILHSEHDMQRSPHEILSAYQRRKQALEALYNREASTAIGKLVLEVMKITAWNTAMDIVDHAKNSHTPSLFRNSIEILQNYKGTYLKLCNIQNPKEHPNDYQSEIKLIDHHIKEAEDSKKAIERLLKDSHNASTTGENSLQSPHRANAGLFSIKKSWIARYEKSTVPSNTTRTFGFVLNCAPHFAEDTETRPSAK